MVILPGRKSLDRVKDGMIVFVTHVKVWDWWGDISRKWSVYKPISLYTPVLDKLHGSPPMSKNKCYIRVLMVRVLTMKMCSTWGFETFTTARPLKWTGNTQKPQQKTQWRSFIIPRVRPPTHPLTQWFDRRMRSQFALSIFVLEGPLDFCAGDGNAKWSDAGDLTSMLNTKESGLSALGLIWE